MKRLTDAQYWEENWWQRQRPRRLCLYRDFDFETVHRLRAEAQAAGRVPGANAVRVLELGAGGSRVLPYLARRFGYRVFGSDFSPAGCRLLGANLALQKVERGVVCEDLFQSSISDGVFDLVYSSGLVEHFDDTCGVVAEHLRLVRPGGRLVIIVPNLQGLQGRIWRRLAPPLWDRHHVFGPRELAACLDKLGVEGVRTGYLGSVFFHIGCGEEWTVVAHWPRVLAMLVHSSLRLANGLASLLFRLSPLRPHTKAFSTAFFAAGTRPAAGCP